MSYQQSQKATHNYSFIHEGLLGMLTGELYASCLLVFSHTLVCTFTIILATAFHYGIRSVLTLTP